MNYNVLIENRKSFREFSDKNVPLSVANDILNYHALSAKRLLPDIKIQLLVFSDDSKSALEGAAGYHSFLVGAPRYLVLLSEKAPLATLNAGYIMEDLLLKLADMGLDSCWLTFTDSELVKSAVGINSELDVAAIVAFGYGVKTTKRIRLNINSMSNVDIVAKHRYMEPKRSIRDLVYLGRWGESSGLEEHIGFYGDMLWEAFYAASLAPSYLNRQAYGFLIHDGGISLVSRPDSYNTGHDAALSLGIVLLHFSAVLEGYTGKLNWLFGDEAAGVELPDAHKLVATVNI